MNCPTPAKTVYFERKAAKQAARRSLSHGKRLRAYKCPCGRFHLTSTKSSQPASERVGEKLRGL